jgi:hypothetical protein
MLKKILAVAVLTFVLLAPSSPPWRNRQARGGKEHAYPPFETRMPW